MPLQALVDSPVVAPYRPTLQATLLFVLPMHQYPIGHATPLMLVLAVGQ